MKTGKYEDSRYWEFKGALLANESSDNQVAFFKAFVKECLSWGTHLQAELQLSYVNAELTEQEKSVLGMLGYKDSDS